MPLLLAQLGLVLFQPTLVASFLQEGSVGWDPISLWKQMGILAKVVVIILFIMSGWSIGVMIDRWMAFNAARNQSRAFAPAVAGALREGKIEEAIKLAERNKKSHLAKVVTAGLMEFKAHQDSPGEIPGETIEASKRALERTEAIVHAELKRGLGGLATIGSTAPFVGLFGTVVGILNAFNGIAKEKATGLAAVAGGISEALVTTAVGLFVAIPAVMMFNYLTGRVEAFDVEMDNSSSELIDYFLKRRELRRLAVEGVGGSAAWAGSGSSAAPRIEVWVPPDKNEKTYEPKGSTSDPWPVRALLLTGILLGPMLAASYLHPSFSRRVLVVPVVAAAFLGVAFLLREAIVHWRGPLSNTLLFIAAFTILAETIFVLQAVLSASAKGTP